MSVSPQIWKRVTENGQLHIDIQRIQVEDQSPLLQCTRCLGYGHGKRFCKEEVDSCSHSKADINDHNAFSQSCPVRKQWDDLARSSVAYC
ncbi:uncharacterized protein LOC126973533 [Leptidea sinapis]|uniref:uncharacterized protein LOC126973533 n=1 Tax=Leptidea sinapis TaxID=189913 RepID=UPI0021C4873B|nr:uncharacterized protein LOC126973533 [Leptidea sinapis]